MTNRNAESQRHAAEAWGIQVDVASFIVFAGSDLDSASSATRPRLVIDLDHNRVVLDGEELTGLNRNAVVVLHLLWEAKGRILSRPNMQAAHPDIEFEPHLERSIDLLQNTCLELDSAIEREEGKGYALNRGKL